MTRPTPAQIPFCRLIVMICPLERETAGFASGFTQSRGGHWEWDCAICASVSDLLQHSRITIHCQSLPSRIGEPAPGVADKRLATPCHYSYGSDRSIPTAGPVRCRLHRSLRRGGFRARARRSAFRPSGPVLGPGTRRRACRTCWLSRCQGQQLSPRLREAAASRRAGRRARPKARPRRLLPPPRPTTRPPDASAPPAAATYLARGRTSDNVTSTSVIALATAGPGWPA